jgi:hypothetical protein
MNARHIISGFFCSVDDDPAAQAFSDYSTVIDALKYAAFNEIHPDFEFANAFPGDHYRLLSGLISTINPEIMLDIGTYRGCSSRVMVDNSSENSCVYTFDITGWQEFDWTVLTEDDFESKRLTQLLEDLSDFSIFTKYLNLFECADFIMLDGPKDGSFEETLLGYLSAKELPNKTRWLFIDDIRFENMYKLWRSIASPKIDLSSFGHFSGSGLVNIQEGLKLI